MPSREASSVSLAALPMAAMVANHEGMVLDANQAMQQLLRQSIDNLRGEFISHLFSDTALELYIAQAAAGATIRHFEYALPLHGTRMTLSICPAEQEDRLLLLLDLANGQRSADSHASQRQTMHSASVMAAMLAHEIKNPLLGIRGAAQLLSQHGKNEDTSLTNVIVHEVDRIDGLLKKLEFFSNEPCVDPAPVNLHEMLERAREVAESSYASHIRFERRYDPSLPEIMGDGEALLQLFVNLIKNASEAIGQREEGTITLISQYALDQRLRLPGSSSGRGLSISISVEDNGGGVAPELRSSLFQPFLTTKPEGKGLGLAIVAKIASDHGGLIELEETAPQGHARFNLLLPAG